MELNSGHINRLIEELEKLPGIGNKSAQRMAYYIVSLPEERVTRLTEAISGAKKNTHYCEKCLTLTDSSLCGVCADQSRDRKTIMVVENPRDLAAYEKTGKYKGLYHVLHGAISPMDGIGPEDINLKQLILRLQQSDEVKEVILATNPTIEGEATAMFAARLIKPAGIRVTRIAHGIPVGGDLEYTDEITLSKAMEGRNEL